MPDKQNHFEMLLQESGFLKALNTSVYKQVFQVVCIFYLFSQNERAAKWPNDPFLFPSIFKSHNYRSFLAVAGERRKNSGVGREKSLSKVIAWKLPTFQFI